MTNSLYYVILVAEVIAMSKLISKCPCCSSTLNITSLQCPDCGVELRNTFELSAFDRLDKEQMEFLKGIGNCHIQGYYFSKPLPEKEFIEFMLKANGNE